MGKNYNCHDWPVMKAQCSTCVFKRTPDDRHWVYPDLAEMVEERMMRVSQICHAPALKGKKQDHLCRGTRDRQIAIFKKATGAGRRRLTALKAVIDWAAAETQAPGSCEASI